MHGRTFGYQFSVKAFIIPTQPIALDLMMTTVSQTPSSFHTKQVLSNKRHTQQV